jgi:hypothetical protein
MTDGINMLIITLAYQYAGFYSDVQVLCTIPFQAAKVGISMLILTLAYQYAGVYSDVLVRKYY